MAKEEGKALIFSTHNLTEVERLCDRIAVVHQGKLVYLGDIDGIKAQTGESTLPKAFFELVQDDSLSIQN